MPPNQKDADNADSTGDEIMRAAAEWRARQDAGLTPAQEAEFVAWLERDERHAEIFSQMEETWGILDRARLVPAEKLGMPKSRGATGDYPYAVRPRRSGWVPLE